MLGAAIRRLQRDAAGAERRADLHEDTAIAFAHSLQRGHGPVHEAEVAPLGDPPELGGTDVGERREYRGECHLHPHVDWPELGFHAARRGLDVIEARDIGRQRQWPTAGRGHHGGGGVQSGLPARNKSDVRPALSEKPGRSPADARAGSGDHDGVRTRSAARSATDGHLRCQVCCRDMASCPAPRRLPTTVYRLAVRGSSPAGSWRAGTRRRRWSRRHR
jgi:hypothetical protein